jgi:hypothetical protein
VLSFVWTSVISIFSSLVPLLGIFPLFIYLLIYLFISKSIKMGLGFGPVLARSGFFKGITSVRENN